jgi:hypothetical protein
MPSLTIPFISSAQRLPNGNTLITEGSGGRIIEVKYRVRRLEKVAYTVQDPVTQKYLKPERLVPVNEKFRSIAEDATRGRPTDLMRARVLASRVIHTDDTPVPVLDPELTKPGPAASGST